MRLVDDGIISDEDAILGTLVAAHQGLRSLPDGAAIQVNVAQEADDLFKADLVIEHGTHTGSSSCSSGR